MGREIRRVPPDWQHPRYTTDDAPYSNRVGQYRPLFDDSYANARREWLDGLAKYEAERDSDEHRKRVEIYGYDVDFWEYEGNPPDRAYYRPEWPEGSATWWQVYETVSEGTPVTPPFATSEELVAFLSTERDFWGQGPVSRAAAERFVSGGWAPSAVLVGGTLHTGVEALSALSAKP